MATFTNHFEAIVASSDDAIISKDLNSIVTSWNRSAEKIFGYSEQEMLGQPITILFPVDRLHEEQAILNQVMRGEQVEHFKTKRLHKDGHYIDVSVTVSPICDQNGVIVGASKIARDITKQVLIEQQSAQFKALVVSTEDAIISKTLDGFIQTWNPAAERMFGFLADEAVGQHITLIFPDDRIQEEEKLMRALREGEVVRHFRTTRVRKDESLIYVSISLSPIFDDRGQMCGVSTIARDITHEFKDKSALVNHTSHDGLTGLLNQYGMMQCMEELLHMSHIRNKKFALLNININGFQKFNEQYGFAFGDQVLIAIGHCICKAIRSSDECARVGQDDFQVCLMGLASQKDIETSANKVAQSISTITTVMNVPVSISASIGVAVFPDDGHSTQALITRADHAQFCAKQSGSHTIKLFSGLLQEQYLGEEEIAIALKEAVQNKALSLVYQPIVDVDAGSIKKVAALVRWEHPIHGVLEPDLYIPIAEKFGLIRELDDLVMDMAMDQLSRWTTLYGLDFQMSINQSQYDLIDKELCTKQLLSKLHQYGLQGQNLIIEISEGCLIQQSKVMMAILNHYESLGIQVAIDNFGTGYSSLGCLKDYTFSMLKIDKSLVDSVMFNQVDVILVEGILSMAKQLGIQVIAEGIETPEQLALLHSLGCTLQEGFHFSKCLKADAFETFMASHYELRHNQIA